MAWVDDQETSSSEGEWRSTDDDHQPIEQDEMQAVFISPLDPAATFDSEHKLEEHLQATYGFTLDSLTRRRHQMSSLEAFYDRCRIVNFLRKHREEPISTLLATLTSDDDPLWNDNDYLIPALQDDALLRMSQSIWRDEDDEHAEEEVAFRPPVVADPLPSKEHMLERGQQLNEQLQSLQELY